MDQGLLLLQVSESKGVMRMIAVASEHAMERGLNTASSFSQAAAICMLWFISLR